MRSRVKRVSALLLVVVMVASGFLLATPGASAAALAGEITSNAPWVAGRPSVLPDLDPALREFLDGTRNPHPFWGKMTPSVQDAALGGTGTLNAAILTDDVSQLGAYLRAHGVDTKIGSVPSSSSRLRVVTIELPVMLLEKVAALDRVIGIAPAVLPEAPARADAGLPSPFAFAGPAPNTIQAGKGHHVPEAWDLGYTGYGVKVAVMDSGVDFGHPDLQGTFATEAVAGSPYLGWPLVFDPNSMASYLLGGSTFPESPGSWYADTSFTSTAAPVTKLLSPFLGRVYNVSGITSASGTYHVGLHPDNQLPLLFWDENVGVLVTDSTTAGVYDTVYVDLDDDYNFTDDKPMTMASPASYADYYNASADAFDFTDWTSGDGMADFSGGLVYFIADGTNPIPYSDVIADRYGLPNSNPDAGDLVALMIGDVFAPGGDHGTLCASAVVAQNVTGAVQGFAPLAKMIAVGNIYAGGFFYDVYSFVGEGYDGIPDTGDEATVASASFGSSGIFNDGWDFEARWLDWHASFLYPDTAFTVSSGNGGHGFGTVTTPGSSNGVITVGASTSYQSLTPFPVGASDAAAHSTFGDVQPWSNRGPNTPGMTKPDIVTVGAWATGDGTLNEFGGAEPWYVWGGTSLSAPATAGIYALLANAWFNATSTSSLPNGLGKAILVGSADNIHYDSQVMGHGLANALRAVQAASLTDGMMAADVDGPVPYAQWGAGDYQGDQFASFARLLFPGDTATQTFDVFNMDSGSSKAITISDWELQKVGTDTWFLNTTTAKESLPDFGRPDYLINLTSLLPAGTNLVKATLSFPLAQLDPDGNYLANSRWRILLYDWSDDNGNGSYWNDKNANGVVNAGEMDSSSGLELQRFTYGYPTGTNLEVFVHDPAARIHDGLLLGIQRRTRSALVPVTNLTVTVDYYEALDAPWLSTDITSATIPTGCSPPPGIPPCSVPVVLEVTLPSTQPLGTLSGAVTITDGTMETQIPVIVNVAADGTDFAFGGDPASTAFLDNNRMFGGADWDWRAEAGDWRFFYTDIPDGTPIDPGSNLLVHTWWTDPKTDIDTYVLGPTEDPFSMDISSDYWGPYTLDIVGESARTLISAGRWRFQTATGGPDEWVSAPLGTGLHEIAMHNVLNGGTGPSDLFNGEVGTFSVAPTPWMVSTLDVTGKTWFNVTSSLTLPGLSALAFGISAPSMDAELPITGGDTYVEFFNTTHPGLIDIGIDESFAQGMDIDLYLYRWTGLAFALVGSSAGPTALEEVRLVMPQAGMYRVLVDGYSVPTGTGYFDIFREIVDGDQLTPTNVPSTSIAAGTTASFNVTWDFAGERAGTYAGLLLVGPTGAPAVPVEATFILVDDLAPEITGTHPGDGDYLTESEPTITVDIHDPDFSSGIADVSFWLDGLDLSIGSVSDTEYVWPAPFTLSQGMHTAYVAIVDGEGFTDMVTWSFMLDSNAPALSVASPDYSLTRTASTAVSGTTDPEATVKVNGVATPVSAAGAFTRTVILAEGVNAIVVQAKDAAGNTATVTRSVTLDTVAPSLTVTAPTAGSRSVSNVVTVVGTTEVGAEVWVNGVRVAVGTNGVWTVGIALADGTQTIATIAEDAAGNTAQDSRSIEVGPAPDSTAPVVTVTSPAEGATTDQASVLVTGTVDDASATVLVNGIEVRPADTGAWSLLVALAPGANTISVSAVDAAGNRAAAVSRTVTYSSPVPGLNQAVTDLSGNLVLGIAVVLIALMVLQLLVYWNLNRKIGDVAPKPSEGDEGPQP